MRAVAAVLIAVGLSLALPLAAQESVVPVGGRVRVLAPPSSEWRTGTLVSLTPDLLLLATSRRATYAGASGTIAYSVLDSIPLAAIQRFEVARLRSKAGPILKGTALGFLVGGLSGGLIGYATTQCTGCEDPGIGALVAVITAPIGALVGGIIGFAGAPVRWEPVPLPSRGQREPSPGSDP